MPHETTLIATVVAGFALAFVLGMLAQRLRLPAIVGYLLAGIVIGPYSPGFVADAALANQLAEIGVILLMFGVGLHFSVADLMRVRAIAIPGAVTQIAVAVVIGALLGRWWDWDWIAGVVFGLALSVASTVVLLRALEDNNLIRTQRAQIAIGWLVVEDLATVVVLVLLPTLASLRAPTDSGAAIDISHIATTLGLTLGKVALFIALMLIVGKRTVPYLLERVVHTRSRELFTLAVLAVSLGIAYGSALLFDVSLALGAFFAGIVLSESELSHKAGEDMLPLRDAFAVLFFVSVGMLFDPAVLLRDPLGVLAVVFVIVIGKSLASFLIVVLYRHPIRTAFMVSASLAQIGEFSFILIGLGLSLNLAPAAAQSLILAGAIISIALNPLAFRLLPAMESWIRRSPRLYAALDRSTEIQRNERMVVPNDWSGHVVLVGHGRVGSVIAAALENHGVRYAVVEADRKVVERLTAANIPAVIGDIADPIVMQAVALNRASLLAFAIPDSFQLRHALEEVRVHNPAIEIVARTHTEDEANFLREAGVGLVLMGERELGLQMADYALRHIGIDTSSATPRAVEGTT